MLPIFFINNLNVLWNYLFVLISAIFRKRDDEVLVIKCQKEHVNFLGSEMSQTKKYLMLPKQYAQVDKPLVPGLVKFKFVLIVNLLKMLPNTVGFREYADCDFEKKRGQIQLSESQSTWVTTGVSWWPLWSPC